MRALTVTGKYVLQAFPGSPDQRIQMADIRCIPVRHLPPGEKPGNMKGNPWIHTVFFSSAQPPNNRTAANKNRICFILFLFMFPRIQR